MSRESRLYSARPVLISGTDKTEKAPEHSRLLRTTLNGVNKKRAIYRLRVVCVASDGESRRGAALLVEYCNIELPSDSPIYPILHLMVLMDFLTGEDEVTIDKDYKHVFKRLRNLTLRAKGLYIDGVWITPPVV